MRILIVTMFYLPDGGPSAPLFALLCEELACRGRDVTVMSAVPHYPTGKVPPEFSRGWIQRSREQGVKVVRVRVPSIQRSRLSQRMIQFLSYQFGVGLAGLFEEYDVALFAGPALNLFLPFTALSVLRGKPAVLSVHDVYPDVGVTLGIFRSKAAIAAVASLERFCLHRSKVVRILSESFISPLRSRGVPPEKMTLIYDWVDTDLVRPLPRKNSQQVWDYLELGDRRRTWQTFRRAFLCRPVTEGRQRLLDYVRPLSIFSTNLGMGQAIDQRLAAAGRQHYLEAEGIIAGDHGRGADELVHRGLKDFGFEELPFLRFAPNGALYYTMLVAFFLFECFKEDVCGEVIPVVAYATTLRRRLIDMAAKIVRHAGKIILKVAAAAMEQLQFGLPVGPEQRSAPVCLGLRALGS